MASDPSYVRLANRLKRGCLADVLGGTGWRISGLDVRRFPTDPAEKKFVRNAIKNGVLEPASRAEWEEAHEPTESEAEMDRQREESRERGLPIQESRLRRAAALDADRMEAARAAADAAREAGESDEDESDDDANDEKSDEEPAPARRTRKAAAPRRKSSRSK